MQEFLSTCRFFFGYAFFFSMFINMLQLTFSLFMLLVFDKVLVNYNLPTLMVITVAALVGLFVMGTLEWIRSRLLVRAGVEFDKLLSQSVLSTNLREAASPRGSGNASKGNLRDVQTLRNYLGGSAVFAFFDLPWMPIFFTLIFILHPLLGMVAVFGGVVSLLLGVTTDRLTRKKVESAALLNTHVNTFLASTMRNAGIVRAMGMIGNVSDRWTKMNNTVIRLQTKASQSAGLLQSGTRSFRMSLQVLIYALGAYLTVIHESGAGVMIAASIVMGRALAPIDQGMGAYKLTLEAKAAYKRLKHTLDAKAPPPPPELPDPLGQLTAENVSFSANNIPILHNVSFALPAGQSVAIIGPSAAGKSTLCKVLLNIWEPDEGVVSIDGTPISAWDMEKLGPFVGYLPQDVELFAGSVAENIARLGKIESEKVILAAKLAGVHHMILGLPKGYDTQIGDFGTALSGGQRQRVGLARALYGDPRLVVLDEPNSNLDDEGEQHLLQAVMNMRQRGTTVLLVTHKPNILSVVDNIILMQGGRIALCGPRADVLQHLYNVQREREAQAQEAAAAQQPEDTQPSAQTNAIETSGPKDGESSHA